MVGFMPWISRADISYKFFIFSNVTVNVLTIHRNSFLSFPLFLLSLWAQWVTPCSREFHSLIGYYKKKNILNTSRSALPFNFKGYPFVPVLRTFLIIIIYILLTYPFYSSLLWTISSFIFFQSLLIWKSFQASKPFSLPISKSCYILFFQRSWWEIS